jgi:uncharacterized membrane protein YoaK (UPF0700 family)
LAVVSLTAVAGSVDAVSYLNFDRVFTSNMTGNLAVLGFGLLDHAHVAVLRPGLALSGFVLGLAVGGSIVRVAVPRVSRLAAVAGGLVLSAMILAIVMVMLLAMGDGRHPHADLLLPAVLAAGMGLQGAVVRILGVQDVPTTVVTSTLTGLVADGPLGSGTNVRWRRRVGALAAFVAGTAAGAGLGAIRPGYGLIPALLVTGVVACMFASCAGEGASRLESGVRTGRVRSSAT